MNDIELADEIIQRLNKLIGNEAVREALERLSLMRLELPDDSLAKHTTIQVLQKEGELSLGFLGMLNGIVGSIEGGDLDKCGYIAAVYDKPESDSPVEDWKLSHFDRFDK